MTEGSELRRLKSEIGSFECLNYEDLRFYTNKISEHIRKISVHHPQQDPFLKQYIDDVLLKHVSIVEQFIESIPQYRGREEFITKALKYHFNCIIDSYTYATIAYRN